VQEKMLKKIPLSSLDAQCMSKVVGVGLHQALVIVTIDNDVKVEALSESASESLLASMFMEVQASGGLNLLVSGCQRWKRTITKP
jgi:hypothetical protein